jgi:hypothetical protein
MPLSTNNLYGSDFAWPLVSPHETFALAGTSTNAFDYLKTNPPPFLEFLVTYQKAS